MKKICALFLVSALLLVCFISPASAATGTMNASFKGMGEAGDLFRKVDHPDVKTLDNYTKNSIYLTSALNVISKYERRLFVPGRNVTSQEALAIILRAAGKEADALKAGLDLNTKRAAGSKKTEQLAIMYDGYIQIARDLKLISANSYNVAFDLPVKGVLDPVTDSFVKTNNVTRQEFAYYLATVLGIKPTGNSNKLVNQEYTDALTIDRDKINAVEALLQNDIMTGDSNRQYNPQGGITLAEASVIMEKALSYILPKLSMKMSEGYVEGFEYSQDATAGQGTAKTIIIRLDSGKYDKITVNDTAGTDYYDFLTFDGNALGYSSLIKKGVRLTYITASDGTVRYAHTMVPASGNKYVAGEIVSVDIKNNKLTIKKYFNLTKPDSNFLNTNTILDMSSEKPQETYAFNTSNILLYDGKTLDISEVVPGDTVILHITDKIVTIAEKVRFGNVSEKGILTGVVEENNPAFGYITLYSDGAGDASELDLLLSIFRTYNYAPDDSLITYRNYKKCRTQDILAGDTVFLKLDNQGEVYEVHAISNYLTKTGVISAVRADRIVVEYSKGSQETFELNDTVNVFKNGKLINQSNLSAGDMVKLYLNQTPNSTDLKNIIVEHQSFSVKSLYKAEFKYVDKMTGKIVLSGPSQLNKDKWEKYVKSGAFTLPLDKSPLIYEKDALVDKDYMNLMLSGREAYIATRSDFGGTETAAALYFIDEGNAEVIFDDVITSATTGKTRMRLQNSKENIDLDDGTIVVKNNKLLGRGGVTPNENAYIVATREPSSKQYTANIVFYFEPEDIRTYEVYRGRISAIDQYNGFTVSSFSKLEDFKWNAYNTPKTFKMDKNTTITTSDGIINQADFLDWGDGSYKEQVAYIISDGITALQVSFAPYGEYNFRGDIEKVSGGTSRTPPTDIFIRNCKVFNKFTNLWSDNADLNISITSETIVYKNNKVTDSSALTKGDKVRVLKVDNTSTGNALFVIVEK